MIVVASSGNNSDNSVDYPAALHTTIGVGATDFGDSKHGYSNYGSRLDLVAPAGFETTSRALNNDLYAGFGGTSQAAPVVSGVAGLLFSESRDENLNLSNNDIVHLLERTAKDLGASGRDNEYGHGRVNAYEALRRLNDPYEVSHGTASFTKIYDDDNVSFPNGFTTENGTSYGAGTYICDIYKLSASASFNYKEKPWFWLPVTEKGYSAANPNDATRYLSKSVSKNSAQATTYFYYVESNANGQEIGWVPFDPTVHKRNGQFEYTVIGKPAPPPLSVSLSGPSVLDHGQSGTWTASVSGGSGGSASYTWEYRPAGSYLWQSKGCTGSSCSHTFYNSGSIAQSGGIRVTVAKGSESKKATQIVSVNPDDSGGGCGKFICAKARERLLQSVRADARKGAALLRWRSTAGAALPSGFVVQHRRDSTARWKDRKSVPRADSVAADTAEGTAYRFRMQDLSPGTHQFRLRVRGAAAKKNLTSQVVSAEIRLTEAYEVTTYPNPVRTRATVKVAVKERQAVTVAVYDVLGRRMATVHDGPLPAQDARRFTLHVSEAGLSSGTYFMRVQGETFAVTRRLTVVR